MTASEQVGCVPWCDAHDDAGVYDQHCRSTPRVITPRDHVPGDPAGVFVSASVHQYRRGRQWVRERPTVVVRVLRDGHVDLTPHEARVVAQRLLAAADMAAGEALTA